jgi:tetratricopeptide (TPR) repeat protein
MNLAEPLCWSEKVSISFQTNGLISLDGRQIRELLSSPEKFHPFTSCGDVCASSNHSNHGRLLYLSRVQFFQGEQTSISGCISLNPKKQKVRSDKTRSGTSESMPPVRGWRLWLFRLIAMLAIPVLCFVILEVVLRVSGFGYPTTFLLSVTRNGRSTWEQNNQFGWRFFGRQMARTPAPLSIPQSKPKNSIRIVVFGESAAFGDPEPHFGLPRMLEAMLSLRYPGTHFEVVNAAMTGINSHVIVPIARDCTRANGDAWVVYMGNNEVVGPFGAGTVFGPQSPPQSLIRGSIALKSTRTGEWLDSFRRRWQKPPPEKSEWGGMMMFLEQQVRSDDPRMNNVYRHFERNLEDIIEIGRRSGAGIVVSTVAVNLKDCAPFASAHRPEFSESDSNRWTELYQRGVQLQDAGSNVEASEQFHQAEQLDDSVAELRFREGWCALALGQLPAAHKHFVAARDLDTLRFRCDSRLNELVRQTTSGRERERILLADAEHSFADQSPDGLPGDDLFYEHVHLTFAGNYLLARTIAAQIEMLIADRLPAEGAKSWPAMADCARRLAWSDWNEQSALSDILTRLSDPPFTQQLNHDSHVHKISAWMEKLSHPSAPMEALKASQEALIAVPDDPFLNGQLAFLKEMTGDLSGAILAARRATELLPSNSEGWMQLGSILAGQQKYDEAATAFERAFQLDPENVWALQNFAESLVKLNRRDEAIREYRRALSIKPRFGIAWLGLGQALEAEGKKAEAEDCYRKALSNRIHRATELATLARFCQSRGWSEAAATNYADALKLSPSDAKLHLEAGQTFEALSRPAEAARHFGEAVRLAPDLLQARYLYGLQLGHEGKPVEAAEQFREAVRIMPELIEARLNLGIALMNQGKGEEALQQFEEVLRRSPTNALALRKVQEMRARESAK